MIYNPNIWGHQGQTGTNIQATTQQSLTSYCNKLSTKTPVHHFIQSIKHESCSSDMGKSFSFYQDQTPELGGKGI